MAYFDRVIRIRVHKVKLLPTTLNTLMANEPFGKGSRRAERTHANTSCRQISAKANWPALGEHKAVSRHTVALPPAPHERERHFTMATCCYELINPDTSVDGTAAHSVGFVACDNNEWLGLGAANCFLAVMLYLYK